MPKRLAITAAAIASCIPGAGVAATNCANATSQVKMKDCATADYRAADRALNAQWRVTLAKMRAMDRSIDRTHDKRISNAAALQDAQRAWMLFRDAQCRAEGMMLRGGTGEGLAVTTCLKTLIRNRTMQLRTMAKGLE